MPELSKMITDRVRSAGKVLAAGATHQAVVVSKLDSAYGAGAEAGQLLTKVMAALKSSSETMQAKDLLYLNELSDDAAPRANRDALSDTVHNQVINIRSFVGGNFTPELVAQLGFKGPTPVDPVAVLRLAQAVEAQLGQVDLSKPRLPLVQVNAQDLIDLIHAPAEALQKAIDQVFTEKREAEEALLNKRKATDKYDKTFSLAANLPSTLLQTAGEDELARRVRPSMARPGQTVEDAGESSTSEFPEPVVTEPAPA